MSRGPQETAFARAIAGPRPNADQNKAVEQLARRYAQLLDGARGSVDEVSVYVNLGPKYQAALAALGLVWAGGVAPPGPAGGDKGGPTPATTVTRLRAKRATRSERAAG